MSLNMDMFVFDILCCGGNTVNDRERGKKQPVPAEILVVIYKGQSMLRNCTETPSCSMKHKLAVKTQPKWADIANE